MLVCRNTSDKYEGVCGQWWSVGSGCYGDLALEVAQQFSDLDANTTTHLQLVNTSLRIDLVISL